ncbi:MULTISPECIES: hypothetical protein [unclassified Streptomyces]|uniref:hypothetical protein n=1 Tax=unclassified Streptomyces TaxID=2593676 RepID=UPI002E0DDBAA|nr:MULTISPECIES: hypothetical protein [unclassified Streptomyces]WSR22475.1 hypothetical protein OG573_27340 [Streptomyces sp. NBC_01205]
MTRTTTTIAQPSTSMSAAYARAAAAHSSRARGWISCLRSSRKTLVRALRRTSFGP